MRLGVSLETENEVSRNENRKLGVENRVLADENRKLQRKFEGVRDQWEASQKFVSPEKASAGSVRGSGRSSHIEAEEVLESKEVLEEGYV